MKTDRILGRFHLDIEQIIDFNNKSKCKGKLLLLQLD